MKVYDALPRRADGGDAEHRNRREEHEKLESQHVLVERRGPERTGAEVGAENCGERGCREGSARTAGPESQGCPDQGGERSVEVQRDMYVVSFPVLSNRVAARVRAGKYTFAVCANPMASTAPDARVPA